MISEADLVPGCVITARRAFWWGQVINRGPSDLVLPKDTPSLCLSAYKDQAGTTWVLLVLPGSQLGWFMVTLGFLHNVSLVGVKG